MSADSHISELRRPLFGEYRTYGQISDDILSPIEGRPNTLWYIGFIVAFSALVMGVATVAYQILNGIGTWGLNKTVGWAWDITNFVFWVGIGHAGTLISAILLLFRQKWRMSINRAAEAMTIFAVMCAGVFPIIHMGRPWLAHWVFPYPNMRGDLWVNFRSPLLWDVFAISTYFIVSAVFWYVGLIPDLATLRDRAARGGIRKKIYSFFSFGWNGSHRSWHRYEILCIILAGLATPLVVSVHTIVAFDFATSVIPGWHTTILPPYFVCGAVFSGFAMVLTLLIITRKVMNFEKFITVSHIESMCKILLLTGMFVSLAYVTELFVAWYSGNIYERYAFLNRVSGPLSWSYWIMVTCNVVSPHFFWFKKIRTNMTAVFILSIVVNIGMWFERFVIIVTSIHRDYLPSSWALYSPTKIEVMTFIGSFGLFFTMFLLFVRFLPAINVAEVKSISKLARKKK